MTDRAKALRIAKQGFQAAMRRAQYKGTIAGALYEMDRDDWSVRVQLSNKLAYRFAVAKSWEP